MHTPNVESCSQIRFSTKVAHEPTVFMVTVTFLPNSFLHLAWWSIISSKHSVSKDSSNILLWSTNTILSVLISFKALKSISSTEGTSNVDRFNFSKQYSTSVLNGTSFYVVYFERNKYFYIVNKNEIKINWHISFR